MGWGWNGRLFEFDWVGGGLELGAYSRLGANRRFGTYSNKYGKSLSRSVFTRHLGKQSLHFIEL